jgi:hypothetical protein
MSKSLSGISWGARSATRNTLSPHRPHWIVSLISELCGVQHASKNKASPHATLPSISKLKPASRVSRTPPRRTPSADHANVWWRSGADLRKAIVGPRIAATNARSRLVWTSLHYSEASGRGTTSNALCYLIQPCSSRTRRVKSNQGRVNYAKPKDFIPARTPNRTGRRTHESKARQRSHFPSLNPIPITPSHPM